MKIRIADRILVAFAGLLMLAGCAAAAAQLLFGKDVFGYVSKLLSNEQNRIWLIIALVLLVVLGVYCVLILFRHRGQKDKFIMQKTENGELAISLKAMESMVLKCLEPHKELTVQSVQLENQKGGLLVKTRGTVAGNVSIPLTVDALQQQIKQYVTACSGVEVKDIRVQIESSGPDAEGALFAIDPPMARALPASGNGEAEKTEEAETEPAEIDQTEVEKALAEIPAPNASDSEATADPAAASAAAASAAAAIAAAELLKSEAPQEDDDRPIHQRLFSNPEEPCVMPMPPEAVEPASVKTEETDSAEPAQKEEVKASLKEKKPAEEEKASVKEDTIPVEEEKAPAEEKKPQETEKEHAEGNTPDSGLPEDNMDEGSKKS